MLSEARFEEIYIACVYTDLRYGIDELATTVKEKFGLNPFSPNTIFLFCGRRSDRIKALVWKCDGFLLLHKHLDAGTFKCPRKEDDLRNLTYEQFSRLLQGFTIDPGIKKINHLKACCDHWNSNEKQVIFLYKKLFCSLQYETI